MTNCKNCGAPIDIYANRCPYCEAPYEASGDSEKVEKLRHKMIQSKLNLLDFEITRGLLTINEARRICGLDRLDSLGEV